MRKYLAIMLITGVVSCTNTDQKTNTDRKAGGDSTITSNKEATSTNVELKDSKVQAIYNGYIALKNALVNTRFEDAQQAALVLKKDLASYKGCENTSLIADHIANAKDIKEQRKEFTSLSNDVIALFKHADVTKGSIFIQHCPMANHGDGGDWLAAESKIQNPYYGDEMMECGRVLEEIKPAK